ncbi:MAG: aminotransferase [Roseomonas sp.]|nr:aminotransferase [Roseomonas sp.]MCA3429268.1 aminotransferase [Roseomonas sp.]
MNLPLSPRIRATGAPPIPAVRGWAARYQGGAGPVLDMTQAVPGYPPHADLLARLAAAAGDTKSAGYGPIEGEGALREALAADMARAYAAPFGAGDIAITAGGNLAFTLAMMTLAGAGDAVMLPAPWYFNHRMALEALGIPCRVLPCRAEDGFLPDPARAATLMQGVRAIVLVTPNNPTGATYSPELIAQFAKLCRDHGAWLVLDETYRDFIPEAAGAPHGLFQDATWQDHVVHLYSFSKAYCVPGHRVGAIAAGAGFQRELAKAIDTVQICPPRTPQIALAWGVEALRDWRAGNRAIMAARAEAFRAAMAPVNAWRIDALGTYFAYLRLPDDAPDAEAMAEALAVDRGLLGLPGSFFGPGQERHLRLAFANAEEAVIAAVPGRLA